MESQTFPRKPEGTRTRAPKRTADQMFLAPESEIVPTFGLIDILPLVLCIGIVVLLYFLVREFQSEQENQEVRYGSLIKRLESLEKSGDVVVPAGDVADKTKSIWASSEAAEIVDRAQKNGTYVLKNSVVSFEPEVETGVESGSEDNDSVPGVVELPDEAEESDSADGDFA